MPVDEMVVPPRRGPVWVIWMNQPPIMLPVLTVLDRMSDALFAVDRDWRFVYVNPRAEALLQRHQSDLLGKELWAEFPDALGSVFEERYRRAAAGQQAVTFEAYFPPLAVWVEVRAYPSEDGLAVFFQDITTRRELEAAARLLESRYRTLFESMAQGVVYQAADGRITGANPAAERILGLTLDQMQGRTSIDPRWRATREDGSNLPGEEHPAMVALRTGQEVRQAVMGVHNPRDGCQHWILVNAVPQFANGSDRPESVFTTFEDITERRQAEAERERLLARIEAERARFEAVLAQLPVGVVIADAPSGAIVQGNSQVAAIMRHPVLPSPDVTHYDEWAGFHSDGTPMRAADWPLARAVRQGETVVGEEFEYQRGDGTRTWIALNAAPVRDADDRIVAGVAVFTDISERKEAEAERDELLARVQAARAEAELERERLREIFQQAPVILAVLDGPEHVFTVANPYYLRVVGGRQIVGKPVREALPEVADQGYPELLDRVYASGEPVVGTEALVLLDRQGTGELEEAYFNFLYQPLRPAGGAVTGILVCGVEVTDQVRSRRALQRQNEVVRTISNNATLALFMMDDRQVCTFMNPAAEAMTGYTLAEVQGASLHDFIHHTRPDGRPFPASECPIDRALPERSQERGEEVFVHKDGTFYPVAFTASPIVEGGVPVGTVIEVQDITERRRAEAERDRLLERERQARAQAEAALLLRQEIVSFISHDLRTPLTAVKGSAQLLRRLLARMEIASPERLEQSLTTVESASGRMEAMIGELLDSTRLEAGEPLTLERCPTDLVALARRAITDYQQATERHTLRLEAALPELVGEWDGQRLLRVLGNLLSNAVKYSPDGGEVTVRLTREGDGPAARAVFSVLDSGLGIPAADLPFVFERFRRASNVADRITGTGIGLAGAKQIVEQHGGSITVASTEGDGSTFTVRLPLT
jgi:PAS domain S-box-containing protein